MVTIIENEVLHICVNVITGKYLCYGNYDANKNLYQCVTMTTGKDLHYGKYQV